MENLKQKTYKAFAWDMIGRFGNQGMGFVISIFLARLLSPEDFGIIAMVNVIIWISSLFLGMGLGVGIVQHKNPGPEHYGSVVFFNYGLGFLFSILLFSCAGIISNFYRQPDLKLIAQVMSVIFIIQSFCYVQRLWIRKHLQNSISTKASLLSMALGGGIGIIMAFKGFGVWSLVAQSLISAVANNVYTYIFTPFKPKLIFSLNALKELWKFGFNIFLSYLLEHVFRNLDSIVIGRMFSAHVLGLYYRAQSLTQLTNKFTADSIMSIMFPVLSKLQDNREAFINAVHKTLHVLSFVTFGMLGLLYLTAQDIIVILFGVKWLPAVEYYKITVLAGFLYPLGALLVNILSSRGNSKGYLKLELLKKIPVLLCFIFGFQFGIKGFLYGMVGASFISMYLNILFAAKELKIKTSWFLRIIGPYILATIVIVGAILLTEQYIVIKSYWVHVLLFSFIFSILFILITRIFSNKGYYLIKEEFTKLQLFEKLKTKAKRYLNFN